jgi:hypothetical protein
VEYLLVMLVPPSIIAFALALEVVEERVVRAHGSRPEVSAAPPPPEAGSSPDRTGDEVAHDGRLRGRAPVSPGAEEDPAQDIRCPRRPIPSPRTAKPRTTRPDSRM